MDRATFLSELADKICSYPEARILIAVDGVDGAGKTYFAGELSQHFRMKGVEVIQASVDGFHNPREIRYRRGRTSPEGFFYDSYNYAALQDELLSPFMKGNSSVKTSVFDHRTDSLTLAAPCPVSTAKTLLVVDGIFLHRPELRKSWTVSLFLEVSFRISYARMAERDASNPDPNAQENNRYLKGQELYLSSCEPQKHATFVIDNSDLSELRFI